jgi:hypothetical protein
MSMFDGAFAKWAASIPPVSQEEQDRIGAECLDIDREQAAQVEVDHQRLVVAVEEFDLVSAYKINLSGLSQRSHGRGNMSSSVYHALCLKDLSLGRIKRTSQSFLCGATSGSFGYKVIPSAGVSCPRCTELVQKNQLKLGTDPVLKTLDNQY